MTTTVTIPPEMSYDGTQHIYTDDNDPTTGLDGGGHVDRFVPAIKDIVAVADYVTSVAGVTSQDVIDSAASAAAALASQNAAAQSAIDAANYAATLTATSTTSTLIGTGSKTFTTQSGKQFQAGQTLKIVSQANSANFMIADVTSYATTSLVVNVTSIGGSGTFADWNISLSGVQGIQGIQGIQGVAGSTTAGATIFLSQNFGGF